MKQEAIKSFGSTTREFESGAHRDGSVDEKGNLKGRCDLIPLGPMAEIMGNDPVITEISLFFETKDPQHVIKAVQNSLQTVPEYEGNYSTMFLEVAKLYQAGAEKYGENNWRRGMPLKFYFDSGIRHYLKTLRGDDDEPHYRGFIWNMLGALETMKTNPSSLDDLIVVE